MAAPFAGRLALLLVAVAVCARADTEAYPSGTAAAGMAAATDCLQQPDCDPARSPRIKVLHEEARIFLYSRMLNDSECDHIIKLAEPHLMRSGVVDTTTGKESVDNVRTSKGMFLARSQDPVIASIEQRIAAVKSSLTLGWALNQLSRQLGSAGTCEGFEAAAKAKPRLPQEPTGSVGSLPGCMTPTGADSGAHSSGEPSSSQQQAHSQTPHRTLSVHWAEALEQHSQRPHTPLHTLCAPDKPCLKAQPSSFPFLEEAAQLEGLMRRPRAMLAALQLDGGGGSGTPLQAHQPAAKKRSRMAAFGQ